MYRSLLKLSQVVSLPFCTFCWFKTAFSVLTPPLFFFSQGTFSGPPESESLKERLLSVETSQTSLNIIGVIVEKLAMCAAFVRYVPLANRVQSTCAVFTSHKNASIYPDAHLMVLH